MRLMVSLFLPPTRAPYRHGAPLPTSTQTTVAQNVGGLSYAAALGVGHHGSRGKTAAATVSGAWFC
jgi:hypothetical protein